jgi:ribosomal protein L24
MRKIKVNDVVIVHTGSNSGKTGKVISLNKKTSSLKVEGVNEVKKAVMPAMLP